MASNGAGVDDFAFAFERLKFFCRSLYAPQGALDVDAVDMFEVLLGDVHQGFDLTDARVVDHDVQPAELIVGVVNRRKDLIAITYISREYAGVAP